MLICQRLNCSVIVARNDMYRDATLLQGLNDPWFWTLSHLNSVVRSRCFMTSSTEPKRRSMLNPVRERTRLVFRSLTARDSNEGSVELCLATSTSHARNAENNMFLASTLILDGLNRGFLNP